MFSIIIHSLFRIVVDIGSTGAVVATGCMQAGASTGTRAAVVVVAAEIVVVAVAVEYSSLFGVQCSDLGVVFAENIILVEIMVEHESF